jgi:hypothetical protein
LPDAIFFESEEQPHVKEVNAYRPISAMCFMRINDGFQRERNVHGGTEWYTGDPASDGGFSVLN